MSDNGTYLQVPPLGSQASLITVFGDHRVNIERTIRGIMALVSSSVFKKVLIWSKMLNRSGVPILCRLSMAFTCLF